MATKIDVGAAVGEVTVVAPTAVAKIEVAVVATGTGAVEVPRKGEVFPPKIDDVEDVGAIVAKIEEGALDTAALKNEEVVTEETSAVLAAITLVVVGGVDITVVVPPNENEKGVGVDDTIGLTTALKDCALTVASVVVFDNAADVVVFVGVAENAPLPTLVVPPNKGFEISEAAEVKENELLPPDPKPAKTLPAFVVFVESEIII